MKSRTKGYWALRRLLHRALKSRGLDEGLTLLEALMAIIVIALTVSAITPAFVLALATRVQSQRAEQAAQLAQKQIDEARLIMELDSVDDPNTDDGDPTNDTDVEIREDFLPLDTGDAEVEDVDAPTAFLPIADAKCDGSLFQPDETEACQVDVDGDDNADFAVQVYRVNSYSSPNGLVAFQMGVRVYHIQASANLGNLRTERTSVGLSSGPYNNEERSYRSAPLSVVYATIARSEADNALCDYFQDPSQGNLSDTQAANKGLTCDL